MICIFQIKKHFANKVLLTQLVQSNLEILNQNKKVKILQWVLFISQIFILTFLLYRLMMWQRRWESCRRRISLTPLGYKSVDYICFMKRFALNFCIFWLLGGKRWKEYQWSGKAAESRSCAKTGGNYSKIEKGKRNLLLLVFLTIRI